jgi:Fe-S cluster biogenesis protein NfuA
MSDETLHPASMELEAQLQRLETIADPASRSTATDLLASVLQFHTAALEQMLEVIGESDSAGAILSKFDHDPLIRSVLLVHDLHPDSLNVRVSRAIADLEPMLQKRGATLELIAAEGGLVRVKIKGSQTTHGSLKEKVEQVLRNAAPEAVQVIVEDAVPPGFVPLDALRSSSPVVSSRPIPE